MGIVHFLVASLNGQDAPTHRLFNIQILKKSFFPIMERIIDETLCPDWHISKLNRVKLYDSENFNHEDCNQNHLKKKR